MCAAPEDPVTDRDAVDAFADLIDHPGGVLSDPGGQFEGTDRLELSFADPPVDGVHARRSHGYADLAGAGTGLRGVVEAEYVGAAERGEADSLHAADRNTNR
ncbi:hypothetical protein GCM10010245_18210 [Streptomyces spectabilis]|nr:hypothetical protein GCM10010245_18210 [Streptomyces spectabilis]